jgi:glycosyltransferase involved in cell wall biosynthesis
MHVADKRGDDPAVSSAARVNTLGNRLRRRIRLHRLRREFGRYDATRPKNLELFSDDRTPDPWSTAAALPEADVYNLHWIAGFIDIGSLFRNVRRDTPMVWTLHDMNAFTGGCHYTGGCETFVSGCGACPALGSGSANDLAAQIFRRKRAAYGLMPPQRLRVVTPSRWMAKEAARSALFGRLKISTIPYGLDTDVFVPRSKATAREVFGVPPHGKAVFYISQSLTNHRKGMDLLVAALDGLGASSGVTLLSVGAGGAHRPSERHHHLGEVKDSRLLSFAYAAADLLVCPTRDDNLPNVVLEAMACGVPVVAFDVGGLPDMVRPGKTGLLAPREDVRALRSAIETLLDNDGLRDEMARQCRDVAVQEYRLELQAQRYRELYGEMLALVASEREPIRAPALMTDALPSTR